MASSAPFITQYVQPKFALARLTREEEIFSLIVTLVKKTAPLVNDPKMLDLLEYIANLVENFVAKKDKINSEDLIKRIYKEIFPQITDEDMGFVVYNIQSLRDRGLIKRIPFLRKMWYYGSNFFFHQFFGA